MLQPIKSTQSTQATEATSATESVRPISEQRPGQTLRDRLYKLPEIQGAKTSATPTEKGNKTSLFASYSIAKTLPTTPITPLPSASPGSTFSNFAGKFSGFANMWAGLGAFQKPESKKEFVSDKWGSSFIDPSLKPYMERYGLERGIGFLESLSKADKLQENRQNPFFQPVNIKKMDKYFVDDEALNFTEMLKTGDKRREYSGILGGKEIVVNKSEIDTLRKIAEDNNLGQTGFQDLLDKTYRAKVTDAASAVIPKIQSVLENPAGSNWDELRKEMPFQTEFSLEDLGGLPDKIKKDLELAAINPAIGAGAGEAAAGLGNLLQLGVPAAGFLGPASAVAGMAMAFLGQRRAEKWSNARFSAIKNGKLATSIDEYSGSEKNNLKEIAEEVGVDANDLVKALSALQISSLYDKGVGLENLSNKYSELQKSDGAVEFSDSGISLRKTFNPFAAKEA